MMATQNVAVHSAAVVSMGQAVTIYSLFLPPLTEVRRATADDPAMRGDVRMGQFGAAIVVTGIGLILSNLTGSSLPLTVGLIMSLIVAVVYETAMRQDGVNNA
jgi:hypothetical protein